MSCIFTHTALRIDAKKTCADGRTPRGVGSDGNCCQVAVHLQQPHRVSNARDTDATKLGAMQEVPDPYTFQTSQLESPETAESTTSTATSMMEVQGQKLMEKPFITPDTLVCSTFLFSPTPSLPRTKPEHGHNCRAPYCSESSGLRATCLP